MKALLGSSKSLCVICFVIITQVRTLPLGHLVVNVRDLGLTHLMKKGHVNLHSLVTKSMNTGQLL